jgi:glycosyltransferase involved in cell wall biosynthesis
MTVTETRKIPVTVAIPVLNEEANLDACLPLLKRFERVVVIDSGSTDRTEEICRNYDVEVINFVWNGQFPKKRNWFLRNVALSTPWVLFLDADERISEAFCDEVERALSGTTHAGFWLIYVTWFLNRPLMFGDVNRKLSLIRVGAGEYEKILEQRWTKLDMELHEHPILRGTIGAIHTRIDHFDDRGFELWLRKHNEYSTWESRRCEHLFHRGGLTDSSLNRRQLRKYRAIGRWWLPLAYFTYSYIYRSGFRDGYAGFAYAVSKSFYFWTISVKIREMRMRHSGSRSSNSTR